MGRLIDADICLNKAWQNFYKQEDEHKKNIDGYDIMRDQFYEQSGFECCQQTIVNAPTVKAIPLDRVEQIKQEVKEWYWNHDIQELAKDPCVVDAMTDMFIRMLDKALKEQSE